MSAFTDWLALPQLTQDGEGDAKFDPSFVTRNQFDCSIMVHECTLCGAAVSFIGLHEDWHRGLGR